MRRCFRVLIDNDVFEFTFEEFIGTDGEDKLSQTSEIGHWMGFHTKTYSHLLDQFRPTTISLTLCASIYFPQLSSTSKGSELVITCLIDFYFQFPQINDYKKNYNNTPFLCKQLFIISLFLWHYDHTFFRLWINICLFFLFFVETLINFGQRICTF